MKAWVSFLVFAFLPMHLSAAPAVVLRYDELPRLIQKNSKDVRAAEILAEASSARHGHRERSRYPRLDFESGVRSVKEVNGSGDSAPFLKIEGSIPLYRGRRDALKDAVQEQETAVRKEETQLILQSQLSLARDCFVQLAMVRELDRALEDAMKLTTQKKKSAKVKVNAGLTTSTDLLEFELHESFLKREKRNLDKDEHELENRLRILLGLPEEAEITLDRSFSHPTDPKQDRYKLTAGTHPLVRKLALQSEQALTVANGAHSQWSPDVNIFASYETYPQGDQDIPGSLPRRDLAAGVRITIPLGDNLNSRNEASAKSLEASALDLQKQRSEQEIRAKHHEYFHEMVVLHELIHDSESQLQKARRYVNQTTQEYERGVKNGPDVLEASRMLYRIEVETIQLIFDYYRAEAGISSLSSPSLETREPT